MHIQENYNRAKPFASFLPAIAGVFGKPLWLFYVNRGQCVSSFGTANKDGAFLEFNAANKAYRLTPLQGFRTFLKINRTKFFEPFQKNSPKSKQVLKITPYDITIQDTNKSYGIETTVNVSTLPEDVVPALIRKVTIKNISNKTLKIESLDGLPLIQPCGVNDHILKNMSRLAEGWFSGVTFSPKLKAGIFKMKLLPSDEPEVTMLKPGNFYYSFTHNGNRIKNIPLVIDSGEIFSYSEDFSIPVNFFREENFSFNQGLTSSNKTPSAMSHFRFTLKPGKQVELYTITGRIENVPKLEKFLARISQKKNIEEKFKRNRAIINDITDNFLTKTSSQTFDLYARQTYLDNTLRGGYPIILQTGGKPVIYYAFSRIHGDMEREYNFFEINPSYFSQGNGNYRDINQNRRCDIYFKPDTGEYLLKHYYNLIQLDGFNPLKVKETYFVLENAKKAGEVIKNKKLIEWMCKPFKLGELFSYCEEKNAIKPSRYKKLLSDVLSVCSHFEDSAFETGYWSDHWHYNTDLLESYMAVYPDRILSLLFKEKIFTFYDTDVLVKPRREKYVKYKENKIRQFNAVRVNKEKTSLINSRHSNKNIVHTKKGKGTVYKTTLLVKLLSIAANKISSLDANGAGIEMESDKPNWYDALNGLPGLLGSSSCETYELERLILFMREHLDKIPPGKSIQVYEELYQLLEKIDTCVNKYPDNFNFWDKTHTAKERYRSDVEFGISGKEKSMTAGRLAVILKNYSKRLRRGLNRIEKKKVVPSYFINRVTAYKKTGTRDAGGREFVIPSKFRQIPLPLFLEGPVHQLRQPRGARKAPDIHRQVRKSGLYDRKLRMYKVNESLGEAPYEIGRAKIFTPGWLENESIWLHMEYKYLLEVLKNDLHEEFYADLKNVLIPFMKPEKYGRSILENVSFIVSSAHPEKELWGRGFVARLSGSTAEFVSIWLLMMTGKNPFFIGEEGKLNFRLKPALHHSFFTTEENKSEYFDKNSKRCSFTSPKNSVTFCCFNKTLITYLNQFRKNTYGKKSVSPVKYILEYYNGKKITVKGKKVSSPYAEDIRDGHVKKISVETGQI